MSTTNINEPPLPSSKTKNEEDKSFETLQEKLAESKKEIRQLKFLFFLVAVILLDFILFRQVENIAGGIVIGVFQLILALFLGKILEIEDVDILITRILNALGGGKDSSNTKTKTPNSDD